ncbi:hypothetical protein GWI33_021753 [Rhynchophorus ferrugineus]|uniref:Uncharacterized protein n=1 Tax=Rhynchophorus ferrugineus TaxID=354439 RepID=A0A834LYH6_RHYFE|nr:hypothetical protein GWI33_021756 [Rhynchophorus ferrugineus]KAF7265001.1 hypothetical protein GWI33_021753 [Rhynchophorus ferrugineus]
MSSHHCPTNGDDEDGRHIVSYKNGWSGDDAATSTIRTCVSPVPRVLTSTLRLVLATWWRRVFEQETRGAQEVGGASRLNPRIRRAL